MNENINETAPASSRKNTHTHLRCLGGISPHVSFVESEVQSPSYLYSAHIYIPHLDPDDLSDKNSKLKILVSMYQSIINLALLQTMMRDAGVCSLHITLHYLVEFAGNAISGGNRKTLAGN